MLTNAQAAAAAATVSPAEWLYIAAAIATLIGGAFAVRSAFNRYITQRQEEAVEKAALSRAIHGNAEATRENTAELRKMGQDFHDFAIDTRATLNGHAERLRNLEVWPAGGS